MCAFYRHFRCGKYNYYHFYFMAVIIVFSVFLQWLLKSMCIKISML
ncbi:hypothetical protein ECL_01899 [Enterobacter cloacae subsp. cloacae ATCC 13047]|uniref:Uncharacterized protein n=1 Tax=Enterobacter cloacae subsp. cloacae (strain ATCC 13047 / DSM 30054 / NBRC 13535 / NCTC 10005 / WDCM 00083 / NCDC 279-56) TaxID=716541 RepID=A0A0H3CLJ6_ENTCC|nr:hypothetical protein ECL_01899 [Enterobacter cloacae subsp. cloacae ATCC 13047]